MPGGKLVVCDYGNAAIRLLNRSLSKVDNLELCGSPHDIAVVDHNNVVVAMPWQKQLQFIQVFPALKKVHTIDIGIQSWSVAAAAGKIFVPKLDYGTGEIGLYDFQGRELEPLQGIKPTFNSHFQADYIAVSRSGDKIFLSEDNTVRCVTRDGEIVYQYSGEGFLAKRVIC